MEWKPLALRRAADLPQETRQVTALYERALKAGDDAAVAKLRASIERRIEDLETFFVANQADDRSLIFEKQWLQLRSLLHKYESGAPASTTQFKTPGATERLTLKQLLAWFIHEGFRRLNDITDRDVENAFRGRAGKDKKMSINDLMAWYDDRKRIEEDLTRRSRAGAAEQSKQSRSRQESEKKKKKMEPIYAWETNKEGEEGQKEEESPAVGMPSKLVEFQIVLTPEQYRTYVIRKRNAEAQKRHVTRYSSAVQMSSERATAGDGKSMRTMAPYVEPTTLETHMYRSSDPQKWITSSGFDVSRKDIPPTPIK